MKNLIKLFQANADKPRNVRVENAGKEATVYIYDVIGGWYGGVEAQQFVQQIAALDADVIHVRINSPGGDVFDGRAIATALQETKARVIAYVDGMAASSASWIALAADEVVMAEGAFFMIHNSWTMNIGDKHTMNDTAKLLDKIDASFVADYAKRTKQPESQIVDWMNAETWFSAAEAVKYGFADRIAENSKAAGNTWNVAAAYTNAPAALVEQGQQQKQTEEPEDIRFNREHMERLLAFQERIAL